MDFTAVLETRRSIRAYTDRDVPRQMVDKLLRGSMMAPSAGNQQPWEFIVLRDRKTLDAIPAFHPYSRMVENAPVAILVCGNTGGIKWPAYWPQDCSAATQNLLLAARDLGLGTVWAGVYPDEARIEGFKKLLGTPESVIPFALVPIGWPAQEFKIVDRYDQSKVHFDSW